MVLIVKVVVVAEDVAAIVAAVFVVVFAAIATVVGIAAVAKPLQHLVDECLLDGGDDILGYLQ